MKKDLLFVFASILAVIMIGSAFTVALASNTDGKLDIPSGEVGFELLSGGGSSAETGDTGEKVDWPDPTYAEMPSGNYDNTPGTLKYTTSEDGKTVTISYEVNGETVSYTVPNNNNYLFGGYGATDDLDRELYSSLDEGIGSYEADKRQIGLFYFLWQGEHGDWGVYDLQKIIDEVGVDAAGNESCGKYGPVGAMHWFAEPLYGYYYANDEWVLRKHAELLTNANIDFLYFDVTNGYSYLHNAMVLMQALHELNEQGYDAPQVVFYTNTSSGAVVSELYRNLYKPGLYSDTWFCLDGKPVIIAASTDNKDNFFTIKRNQWPNDSNFKTDGWPWMDFEWPQRVFKDSQGLPGAISVSVAQHSGTVRFSDSSLYGVTTNRGRSFSNPDGYSSNNSKFRRALTNSYKAWKDDPTISYQGLNFQHQWDHALTTEAPVILVTGWNEWVAQRQAGTNGKINFVDTASVEFSRDTEMMRGGYFDNYYIQLMYNVQRAKGTAPVVVQDNRTTINVTGDFSQWNDILVTYTDAEGDVKDRDAIGFGRTHYTNTSCRNDIVASKVTADAQNMYFYVKTASDISMYDTSSSWMQLYIDVDSDTTGWYGYDFIVNYRAKDAFTTTVAGYNGADGAYGFGVVGEVSYRVKGNEMMITVPLSMLGVKNYKQINLQFKWADSETTYDEMEDFYCDGDAAPLGRLNYIYQNYIPLSGEDVPEDTSTEETTENPGETTPSPDTSDNGTSGSTASDKGCGSCVAILPTAAVLATAALVIRKKRRD